MPKYHFPQTGVSEPQRDDRIEYCLLHLIHRKKVTAGISAPFETRSPVASKIFSYQQEQCSTFFSPTSELFQLHSFAIPLLSYLAQFSKRISTQLTDVQCCDMVTTFKCRRQVALTCPWAILNSLAMRIGLKKILRFADHV